MYVCGGEWVEGYVALQGIGSLIPGRSGSGNETRGLEEFKGGMHGWNDCTHKTSVYSWHT